MGNGKRLGSQYEPYELYEALFEQSADGILLVNDRGIVRANRAFASLHGVAPNELIGRDPAELIHPDDRATAHERLPAPHRYRALHRDGSALCVEVITRSILLDGRTLLQVVVRDVGEIDAARTALRKGEARYRELFDAVPIGLYRTTPEGRIVDVNPALVRILRYPNREALLGIQVEEGYAAAEDRASWQHRVECDGVVEGSEVLWRTYDGEKVWIEEHAHAVPGEDGATRYYEGSAQDISQRKAVEAELAREKAYFEALFSGAPEAVVLCDNAGRVVRANAEFLRLFGYTAAAVAGRMIDDLVVPESRSIGDEARRTTVAVTTGQSVAIETTRYRSDGSPLHVSLLAQPIFVDGRQVGLYAIYRDVGRRMRAEAALREEKARFEQLYEASPEAIVLCTNDSTVLRVNAEFTRLFGYGRDEAIGRRVDVLLAPKLDGLHDEATTLTRRIAEGEPASVETVRRRKDGELVHVSILGKPIRLDGEQIAVYGIYRDIGARKAAEDALRDARRKVEQLHQAALRLERAETLAGVYRNTIDAAERILGYGRCALDIVADGYLLAVAASPATPPERFRRVPIEEAGIAGRVFLAGETLILDDPEFAEPSPIPIRSMITAPLHDIGVFQAASEQPNAYSEADARLLEILLQHASAAIERLRLEAALKEQATHDPLTGVFNRRYFHEIIEQETLRGIRYDHPIGLLMIDVNRFKRINDEHGHHVGDDVLQTIARLLQGAVRETDLVVRYGGDEFLVVLTETGDDADTVADRIRNAVQRNRDLQRLAGARVTVSVGSIAWQPDAGQPIARVLAEVDVRMYEDKRRTPSGER